MSYASFVRLVVVKLVSEFGDEVSVVNWNFGGGARARGVLALGMSFGRRERGMQKSN